MRLSIINHPFLGTTIFGNIQILVNSQGFSRRFFFRAKSATLCMFLHLLFDESPMTEISPMNDFQNLVWIWFAARCESDWKKSAHGVHGKSAAWMISTQKCQLGGDMWSFRKEGTLPNSSHLKIGYNEIHLPTIDFQGLWLLHPWRSTWNIIMKVWFRSFSFLNGWFVGEPCQSSRVLFSSNFFRARHPSTSIGWVWM